MERELNENESQQEPGESLRQAREAAGLTTKEVADSLNLVLSNIEAIEANQYEKMNAGLFVRGYVKNYARFLGLDVEAMVAAADLRLKGTVRSNGKRDHARHDTARMSAIKPVHKVVGALLAAAVIWIGISVLIAASHDDPADAEREPTPTADVEGEE